VGRRGRGSCEAATVANQVDHEGVRRSYDAVAEEYASHLSGELAYKPLDRALLSCLIEQTEQGTSVADLGCGPGHVAAWIATHGVKAVGIDLSQEMVAVGRREYPEVEFREGDLLELPARTEEFGSMVALYSVIHLEASELPFAFKEMHRVLRPSGRLLVAFHAGDGELHRDEWWGHQVDVTFRFLDPDDVIESMKETGFVVEARLERSNYPEEVETKRAYLLVRRQP